MRILSQKNDIINRYVWLRAYYQTMKEYDRFEKGAANSNTSTAILTRQLGDNKSKIIITTIQKLSTFIKKNKEQIGRAHV